jgi:membrane protease YdiL (CAAX protease family)
MFPHSGILPMFTYSIPVLLLIWFYLKQSGEHFSDIGFSFGRITWKAVWVGLISGIVIFYFLQSAFFPLLAKAVPLAPANLKDFAAIRGNIYMYVFVVLMGWIIGGLYEEIVFHGFIFTRLERILPERARTPFAVGVTSIIFAFYHF